VALPISEILPILRELGIEPEEDVGGAVFPEIGEIEEGETIYATSLDEIFRAEGEGPDATHGIGDDRLGGWWDEIETIIQTAGAGPFLERSPVRSEPPEPHCAWYCPIHFFGHAWGIYIRESCILSHAVDVARFVDWRAVANPFARRNAIVRQLLRSAFYIFFLHEQFHHKVESLGFRFLIATGTDRYRPYKTNVYRPSYLTADCLEESLANAESYRRLAEPRYLQRHSSMVFADS
jgi:hypothetical protein